MSSAPTLEVVGLGQVPALSPRAAMLNHAPGFEQLRAQILLGRASEPSNGSSPSSSSQSSLLLLLPLRELAATSQVPHSPGPTPTALAAAVQRAHPAVPRLQLTPSPGSDAVSPATHSSDQAGATSRVDGLLCSGALAASTCGDSDSSSADSRGSSLQRLGGVMVVTDNSGAAHSKRQSGTGDWARTAGAPVRQEAAGLGAQVAPGAAPNTRASPRRLAPDQSGAAPPAVQSPTRLQSSPRRQQPMHPPSSMQQPAAALDQAQVLAAAERQAVAAFPALNMNSPGRPRRQSLGVPQQPQPQHPMPQLQQLAQHQDRTPRLGPTRSQPHMSVTPREGPQPLQLLCVGSPHDHHQQQQQQQQQSQAHSQQSPGKLQLQRGTDPWTSSATTATAAAATTAAPASAAVGGFGSCCSRPCLLLLPAASKGRPRASSFDTPRSKGGSTSSCGGSGSGGGDTTAAAAAAAAGGLPVILRLAAVGTSFSCSGGFPSCSVSSDGRPAQVPQLRLPSLRTLAAAAPPADSGGNGGCGGAAAASRCEWVAAMPNSSRAEHAGAGHAAAGRSASCAPARGWTSARVTDPFMAVVAPVAAAPSARKWEAPAVGVQ